MDEPYALTPNVLLSFFQQHICSHWLLQGHMTSHTETVSRQNL